MGRNKGRKRRNLNGLHEEVVSSFPGGLTQLPPPATPSQDMEVLFGKRCPASLFSHSIERLSFL